MAGPAGALGRAVRGSDAGSLCPGPGATGADVVAGGTHLRRLLQEPDYRKDPGIIARSRRGGGPARLDSPHVCG